MTTRLASNILVANRTFIIPYLIAVCSGTVAMMLWNKTTLFTIINNWRSDWADKFFSVYTHSGDGFFAVFIVLLLAFVRFGYAATVLLSFVLSALIAQTLKHLVFSEALRPLSFFGSANEIATAEGVELHVFNAFPSGHSTTAFAVFFGISLIARNKYWGIILFAAAFVSAWSRVYLAQHFFEDVFFGSLIGVFSAFAVYLLLFPRLDQNWAMKSLINLRS